MKLLAFAATNHHASINAKLVAYAASLVEGAEVELLDLNDYDMPLYSQAREAADGVLPPARRFFDKLGAADAVIVSFAEHNGSFTAAYKNLHDWASRIDMKIYQGKPVVLLATSPGARGGLGVMTAALGSFPYFGADVRGSLTVPRFYQSFDAQAGALRDDELDARLREALAGLQPRPPSDAGAASPQGAA
jgi:NAD(P)H-dependent FMN reductase